MDANLSAEDIHFINDIRNKKAGEPFPSDITPQVDNCHIYINTYREPNKPPVYITDKQHTIIRQTQKDLQDGKRVYMAHNGSKERIHTLAKYIKSVHSKCRILVICQDTLNRANVKRALANPNVEFGKYDLLICSPSVQSGVSYDVPNVFDTVCGIFSNQTNTSGDAVQMLHRVRKPSGNMYISVSQRAAPAIVSKKDLTNSLTISMEHLQHSPSSDTSDSTDSTDNTDRTVYCPDEEGLMALCQNTIDAEGNTIFDINDYMRIYLTNKAETGWDKIQYTKNFVWYLQNEGHNIQLLTLANETKQQTAAITKALKKALADIKEGIKYEYNELLSVSINITTAEAEKLRLRMENNTHTTQEKAQLDKLSIMNHYRVKPEDLPTPPVSAAEWFNLYNCNNTRRHYTNQRYMSEYDTVAECLEQLAKKERKSYEYSIQEDTKQGGAENTARAMGVISMKKRYSKFKLLFRMLDDIGFRGLHDIKKIITRQDLVKSLQTLKAKYLNFKTIGRTLGTLNKNKYRAKKIMEIKNNDKLFLQSMLKFINGSLNSDFGVKIKNTKHTNDYKLSNPYIESGTFTLNVGDDLSIPTLRKIEPDNPDVEFRKIEPLTTEEYNELVKYLE
jgi:hypothetical protein